MDAEQMFRELGYERCYYKYKGKYDDIHQSIKYHNKDIQCWIEFFSNYVEGYELETDGITETLKGFTVKELAAIYQQAKELGWEV